MTVNSEATPAADADDQHEEGAGGHQKQFSRKHDPPRSLQRVPPGTNYCTAYGYNCTDHEHVHDTHTRVMPHERRMNTMAADATIALMCTFFAIDAMSHLTETTFAYPDWAKDECPGLCDIHGDGGVAETKKWTFADHQQKIYEFEVGSECPDAEEKWMDAFNAYMTTATIAAIFSLCGAICSAMVTASGHFLLYDAFNEKVLEMNLVDRFDSWWFWTFPPRVILTRLILPLVSISYVWSLHAHPQWICIDQKAFEKSKTDVFVISTTGIIILLVALAWFKIVEKVLMWSALCKRKAKASDALTEKWCGCTVFQWMADCWSCCQDGTFVHKTSTNKTLVGRIRSDHIQTFFADHVAKKLEGEPDGYQKMHRALLCKTMPTAGQLLGNGKFHDLDLNDGGDHVKWMSTNFDFEPTEEDSSGTVDDGEENL